MDFREFKEELLRKTKEKLGDRYEVEYQIYDKVNQKVERLSLGEKNQQGKQKVFVNIAPEGLYENFLSAQTDSWEAVIKVIEDILANREVKVEVPTAEFVKRHVVVRLISRERNAALLKTCPYKSWMDLAYVMCVVWNYGAGMASSVVTHGLVRTLELDPKELFRIAETNVTSRFGFPKMISMNDYLKAYLNDEYVASEMESDFYILTNDREWNGSYLMGNIKVMSSVYRRLGSAFYILPSSVHELLLLPKQKGVSVKELKDTTCCVNRIPQCVSIGDVLSDSVYEFDGEQVKIVE